MNTTLANQTRHEPSVHHERPQTQSVQTESRSQPVRRVGLVDRAALHLGVALIKWGRRPNAAPRYEHRASLVERALLSNQRDRRVDAERQKAVLEYAQMLRMR